MAALKLKFQSDLQYQRDAIDAVVDLFDGLPRSVSSFSMTTAGSGHLHLTELGVGNMNPGAGFDSILQDNLHAVQDRHKIDWTDGKDLGRHFTVEMETGTGKTYVYLRTLFELNRQYGFTKFVIVVPSVAIREGTLASIRLMREHLEALYSATFDAQIYDSRSLSRIRQFATASTMQILILNIDAFRKDLDASGDEAQSTANVINRVDDRMSGRRPIEFIQSCRPVVVIDEPQNMESPKAAAAIDRLHPLCTLRYSATHKNPYNPVYRLGPVEAHQEGLVKSIEVASVVEEENLNAAFVELIATDHAKMRARLRINSGRGTTARQKIVWVKQHDDLHRLSQRRQEYANSYVVSDISFRPGDEYVEFNGGSVVDIDSPSGAFRDEVRQQQIRTTIEQHLDRERAFARRGEHIKVLSLIFLDRVANYRLYSDDGVSLGRFANWFEQNYAELASKPKYRDLSLPEATKVHDGYFSKDAQGKLKNTRGESVADRDTYDLIMRDKERLLSRDEPVRFIFTHSALREGWDNPNVFQICTLNESRSRDRKRQEIGRGLRLPVNQDGERIHDNQINRLTVIANEAYEDFALALQREYEEDTGRTLGNDDIPVVNVRDKRPVRFHKSVTLDPTFKRLWDSISQHTRYHVSVDKKQLIDTVCEKLKSSAPIAPPRISVRMARIDHSPDGVETGEIRTRQEVDTHGLIFIPDFFVEVQNETDLDRQTITAMIMGSDRASDLRINPHALLRVLSNTIKETIREQVLTGIEYEKVVGSRWEMHRLEPDEEDALKRYVHRLYKVQNQHKTPYDHVEYESSFEYKFAKALDDNEDIRFYLKLPSWFTVSTPVGPYNPDWAIMFNEDTRLYLVHEYVINETKSSKDPADRRGHENFKIDFAKKHFEEIDVPYYVQPDFDDLAREMELEATTA